MYSSKTQVLWSYWITCELCNMPLWDSMKSHGLAKVSWKCLHAPNQLCSICIIAIHSCACWDMTHNSKPLCVLWLPIVILKKKKKKTVVSPLTGDSKLTNSMRSCTKQMLCVKCTCNWPKNPEVMRPFSLTVINTHTAHLSIHMYINLELSASHTMHHTTWIAPS